MPKQGRECSAIRASMESSAVSALDTIFADITQSISEMLHVDHFNLNELIPADLNSFRYSGCSPPVYFQRTKPGWTRPTAVHVCLNQINAFGSPVSRWGCARNPASQWPDYPRRCTGIRLGRSGTGNLRPSVGRIGTDRLRHQTPKQADACRASKGVDVDHISRAFPSKSLISLDHGRITGAPFGYSD